MKVIVTKCLLRAQEILKDLLIVDAIFLFFVMCVLVWTLGRQQLLSIRFILLYLV